MAGKKRGAKTSGAYQQELQHALQLQRAGRLAEAEQGYRYILSRQPRHLQANHLLGLLYFGAGQWQAARQYLEKALQHHPGEAELHNNLGNVLRAEGQPEQALQSQHKAATLAPRNARYLSDLAWSHSEAGDMATAIRVFQQAASLAPEEPGIQVGLGNVLRDTGDFGAAAEAFSRALEISPGLPEALLRLAQLHDYRDGAFEAEAYAIEQAWQSSAATDDARIDLGFARARVSGQRGDVSTAFDSLAEAHNLLRRHEPFDCEATRTYFKKLQSAPLVRPLTQSANGPRPVFVLGLPRSGTSLVEQVLASHSRVVGAGELSALGRICGELESASGDCFAEAFAAADPAARQQLADRYRVELAAAGNDSDWVVDKLPANFLAIGLIQSLFPDALIVHCQRDAAATCWSIYNTRFAQPHSFAHDLEDLAYYHGLYSALMAHWDRELPGRIVPVSYEALVSDPSAQIPALLALIGLDVEDACLNFHETVRPVRTASALQVRQPIYREALAGYRAFDTQLQPLYRALDRHGAAPEAAIDDG